MNYYETQHGPAHGRGGPAVLADRTRKAPSLGPRQGPFNRSRRDGTRAGLVVHRSLHYREDYVDIG